MARDEQIDKETQSVLAKNKQFQDLTGQDAWKYVREQFTNQILDLQSIANIDEENIQNVAVELKARKIAAEFLFEWLKWIEGQAVTAVEMKTIVKKTWLVKTD